MYHKQVCSIDTIQQKDSGGDDDRADPPGVTTTMTEMDLYRSLGRAAAKRRNVLGLSQAEVALEIGLTRASLANIETGRQKVMLHHVYKLVSALQLSSILDLLPPSFAFGDDSEPLPLSRTDVTVRQKKQLENVVRLALAGGRSRARR